MTSNEALHRRRQRSLPRVRRLAHWLDDAIPLPVVNTRVGLDSIIGLIPGVGDATGLALSSIVVGEAVRVGAPRRIINRMVGIVTVDFVVGLVPIAGDLFDIYWQANTRNLGLLEDWLAAETEGREHD